MTSWAWCVGEPLAAPDKTTDKRLKNKKPRSGRADLLATKLLANSAGIEVEPADGRIVCSFRLRRPVSRLQTNGFVTPGDQQGQELVRRKSFRSLSQAKNQGWDPPVYKVDSPQRRGR